MKQLIHNGVMMPKKYEAKDFSITIRGKKVQLTPEQEEMAVAFTKKFGTEYVEDKVFVKNFFNDFSKALGTEKNLPPEEVNFDEITRALELEKQIKLNKSKEEKKKDAEARKAIREANKQQFGFATVDGQKVEVGNYVAEPSCIFMGRGKHPMRGRWKQGPTENDIILNLSPDSPTPPGNWKKRDWCPDDMWIAKWDDRLQGKEKYLWLADTSTVKQNRDKEKFEQAKALEKTIKKVRYYIMENLKSEDLKNRKVATACYLIDALKLRVGDEKDKDEADTVGATTLRPDHIKIGPNNVATFDFLGKDAVRWHKEIQLPESVAQNIREFMQGSNSSIFKGIRSKNVAQFLSDVVPNLTAKVFRTYHATKAVKEYLTKDTVQKSDPDYVKKQVAATANLQAAIVCNHKRKLPKNWANSLKKKRERLRELKAAKKKTKKTLESIEKTNIELEKMKAAKDYNLQTSLKSYIDPRVYRDWGRKVEYDWKSYYSKTLQRKFSWIDR
jgi:DNA topoisomerase-1